MNVFESGWQIGPFGLIARKLDDPGFAITNLRLSSFTVRRLKEGPLPEDLWTEDGVYFLPVNPGHFPYHHPVEPD